MTARRAALLIAIFCSAQMLGQIGGFTFAALLPTFMHEWALDHAEAGWLSGIFFGAYALSVPVLLTLTDRIRPKRIYVFSLALTVFAHLGMALFADGFWSGLVMRVLAGFGWAGTYMVGLRAMSDELSGAAQSRAVAFNAASIGVSGAASFLIAGQVGAWLGWQAAFLTAAASAVLALAIAAAWFPRGSEPQPAAAGAAALLDFRPVLRNRSAMAYSLGYCVHTWEMFTVRSWAVAFLTFAMLSEGATPVLLLPTVVAMLMELTGTVTSVLGNEVAMRIGRQRWIGLVMLAAMACACVVGFSAAWGYAAAAALCLLYNAIIYADSASLTAGTVGSAEPGRKGATLAVHALLGYGGGFLGPLVMGLLLNALGGDTASAWGFGFGHLALVMLVGPLALVLLRPRDLPGDRPTR